MFNRKGMRGYHGLTRIFHKKEGKTSINVL
jgi:hypothetical protein